MPDPAAELVESVMKRAGITEWTVLGSCKGADLELLRFKHPFMDFDVPAILGEHVTLTPVPVRCTPRRATARTTS